MTATPKEDAVRAAAARRGLAIEPFGLGWRIYGPGVDLLALKLADLGEKDLAPHVHTRYDAWFDASIR